MSTPWSVCSAVRSVKSMADGGGFLQDVEGVLSNLQSGYWPGGWCAYVSGVSQDIAEFGLAVCLLVGVKR